MLLSIFVADFSWSFRFPSHFISYRQLYAICVRGK